jgi:hypothetical protein
MDMLLILFIDISKVGLSLLGGLAVIQELAKRLGWEW